MELFMLGVIIGTLVGMIIAVLSYTSKRGDEIRDSFLDKLL